MSLIVEVTERVIETVSKSTEPMLISGNANLLSPTPNLIAPASTAFEAVPVITLFFVFSAVVGVSIALWRSAQVRRYGRKV